MQFFPDPTFGWVYLGTLLALLAAASVSDLRYMKIPKQVTLTALALGIIFNVSRVAWLAAGEHRTWPIQTANPWLGGFVGLLFALTGLLLGFVIYTAIWILGACGGGDVKLFTAIGAWVGPITLIYVLMVTVVTLIVYVIGRTALAPLRGDTKALRTRKPTTKSPAHRPLMTHALTMSVATVLVLGWTLRHEMHLFNDGPVETQTNSRI